MTRSRAAGIVAAVALGVTVVAGQGAAHAAPDRLTIARTGTDARIIEVPARNDTLAVGIHQLAIKDDSFQVGLVRHHHELPGVQNEVLSRSARADDVLAAIEGLLHAQCIQVHAEDPDAPWRGQEWTSGRILS